MFGGAYDKDMTYGSPVLKVFSFFSGTGSNSPTNK
jgi:hypothetical protein